MMTTNTSSWEKFGGREGKIHEGRRKNPSFSSSLLDAIYHSIDVSEGKEEMMVTDLHGKTRRRNHAIQAEEEIANLRRAIMVEKWMENYSSSSSRRGNSRRVNSDSSSSTDSSFFSSSETESASKSSSSTQNPKHEGRFMMRTKSRALKIYGDLKKVKQPISPGGKIANFLNSIFNSSRNANKKHQHHHHPQGMVVMEDWSSVRKSRSVNDSSTSKRSCFNRPQPPPPAVASSSSRIKSNKRSVRFCPVGVIVDEYSQPCGHTSIIYDNDPSLTPIPSISSHYIKKNIESLRNYHEELNNPNKKHKYRGFYNHDDENDEDDDNDGGNSCTSSDLFELENIGLVGMGSNGEELPVYGTTNLKMNQAIAKGLLVV